jgi:CrcB protein
MAAWVARQFRAVYPWGTFAVNIVGCLVIGLLVGVLERHAGHSQLRALFVTGFCGGYTTFSTFAAENVALLEGGHWFTAALYTVGSVLTGLAAVWAGLALSR